MTMAYSWLCYLGGLTVYVCTPWMCNDEESREMRKPAIVYLSVALFCLATYMFATFFVGTGERKLLHIVSSSSTDSDQDQALTPTSSSSANGLETAQTESAINRNFRKEKKRQLLF